MSTNCNAGDPSEYQFCIVLEIECWHRLPRCCEVSSLGISSSPGHPAQRALLEREWTRGTQKTLPASANLWFCGSVKGFEIKPLRNRALGT